MHDVLADLESEVATDGAGRRFDGVGDAHHGADRLHRPGALDDHRDERTAGDEVDQLAEERLLGVLGVVLVRDRLVSGELVAFITGGPLVAMVMEGREAVAAARQTIGATNPVEAATGSIRGDFALEVTYNMVHGSDSEESAEREIGIWFPEHS